MTIPARRLCLAAVVIFLSLAGCKPRNDQYRPASAVSEPDAAEVAAVRDALTRGMQEIACDSLSAAHVGRPCVVLARATAEGPGADPTPPPLGMVRRLGSMILYKGEIQAVTRDHLAIRAAYPTSGRYKTVEVARPAIQSVHLAKSSSG